MQPKKILELIMQMESLFYSYFNKKLCFKYIWKNIWKLVKLHIIIEGEKNTFYDRIRLMELMTTKSALQAVLTKYF